MIAFDEDALICDFAETYRILDYRALPVNLAATLASGLGENSRIVRAMRSEKMSLDTTLLAMAVDKIANLVWMLSDDGKKNRNRPESVLKQLLERPQKKQDNDVCLFSSAVDFLTARARIVEKIKEKEG